MRRSDQIFFKKKGKPKRAFRPSKEYKNSILIVCEGGKTEPNYFEGFPIANIKVKAIGTGKNTISLVESAIKIWKEFLGEGKCFERLWCVFDRDSFPLANYNQAFEAVKSEASKLNKRYKGMVKRKIEISIAYSNEAFELWYLLHFNYITAGISRTEYERMLTDRMGKKYKKNDPNIYSYLENLAKETDGQKGQAFAIKNAKKIRERIQDNNKHNHNPSTSVDELVQELNKYLK